MIAQTQAPPEEAVAERMYQLVETCEGLNAQTREDCIDRAAFDVLELAPWLSPSAVEYALRDLTSSWLDWRPCAVIAESCREAAAALLGVES